MLDIKVEPQSEGRVKVTLNGRLDTHTYLECEQKLKPLLTPVTKVLIMDMTKLDYLSSMGLRVLLTTRRALTNSGGKLLLTNLQPAIKTVIEIGNALPTEAVFESVEEADRYLDLMQRRTRETGSASATL